MALLFGYRIQLQLLIVVVFALAAVASPVAETVVKASTDESISKQSDEAMKRIFTKLVEHTFGPQHLDHAELYYKTRFFASHMQARMRFIASQDESAGRGEINGASLAEDGGNENGDVKDKENDMGLSQSEADQLNSIMREMWLASRKLYRSWGCLSYDLTLCSGQSPAKGSKLTDTDKQAMAEWEKRLSTPFVAGKRLAKDEADDIHELMKGIHIVLLAFAPSK
ncbi:hypothetical protein J3B02_002338 [Coemansia erecta]|uniref:Uncharacterized protein n=1 Tax=Coemansia asiatica TaxID=1052880 RepID=A0A9W7XJ95_9FUNG|nr:hypothetical protein LPJ64_004386 [Coemansia asiatica]KAJ2855106.1 hypothetical protein J3B02_002338 [Coemansia erecta]